MHTIRFTKTCKLREVNPIYPSYDEYRTFQNGTKLNVSKIIENGECVYFITACGVYRIYDVPKGCYQILIKDSPEWEYAGGDIWQLLETGKDGYEESACSVEFCGYKHPSVLYCNRQLSKQELQELLNLIFNKKSEL